MKTHNGGPGVEKLGNVLKQVVRISPVHKAGGRTSPTGVGDSLRVQRKEVHGWDKMRSFNRGKEITLGKTERKIKTR